MCMRGVTRRGVRGGGGLGSGEAAGGIGAPQGWGMGRERMVDVHACSGESGILAENLGHRLRSLFSYFDRQGFCQASLICPAQKRSVVSTCTVIPILFRSRQLKYNEFETPSRHINLNGYMELGLNELSHTMLMQLCNARQIGICERYKWCCTQYSKEHWTRLYTSDY